jgi:kexin
MEDINYEAELFTRYTIAVGAVDKLGRHASYSTAGSELLISAPGGDTADFSHNHVVAQPGGECKDVTVGTSFAAPVVSGVVALMLQARPTLTWRDVQGVLATTARLTDGTDSSWVTNGAQLKHSYRYGFGIVDAHAAVQSARTWTLLSPERRVTAKSN